MIAAIAGIATIVSGLVFMLKYFKKTQIEKRLETQGEVDKEKEEVKSGRRPFWN